ncbi:unnamed protein product [Protopolystoma xenopodis]|uniref:Uncharacterized protein n=1 Tax=Protopolystoma xenopodis TaxID=117903 RepID=A0A3S5CRU5_9PLAT|nr:unnamed protein product [Protopolystoma xenopodis]
MKYRLANGDLHQVQPDSSAKLSRLDSTGASSTGKSSPIASVASTETDAFFPGLPRALRPTATASRRLRRLSVFQQLRLRPNEADDVSTDRMQLDSHDFAEAAAGSTVFLGSLANLTAMGDKTRAQALKSWAASGYRSIFNRRRPATGA